MVLCSFLSFETPILWGFPENDRRKGKGVSLSTFNIPILSVKYRDLIPILNLRRLTSGL